MLGIIGAMPEEVYMLKNHIDITDEISIGNREYIVGSLGGVDVTLVFSRWGKVAAASTTTTLINRFNCSSIIFTGVAGAVDPSLNIGDIILGTSLYQHDMDARPLFSQFQIPLTTKLDFDTTLEIENFEQAIQNFLDNIEEFVDREALANFSIEQPILKQGIIASGDQFISNPHQHHSLKREDKQVLAVEMEGAAVAQICDDYQIPFMVIRTISDKANHDAAIDFAQFVNTIAGPYSVGIVMNYLQLYYAKASDVVT